ncbi:MAG TPA: MlaD family protein [Candidatus Eisenbacteria bacterium]|nr:MlaD family protein [Candidatus Eisenbacteria bacterium]
MRWSQLRVGLTVIFASITLAILIFLMTGTTGLLTKKILIRAYVDNAGGLRVGAPVRLEGVDIGNVTRIRVVSDPQRKLAPVEIMMKISTRYADTMRSGCEVLLSTAGVLGEVFVDLDCREAKGGPLVNGAELPTRDVPQLQDVVRASQGTLQNVDTLVKRMDSILSYVQSGQGSIGKVIYDPSLFNRANDMLVQLQKIVAQANSTNGSIGKLLNSDELYNKLNNAVDSLNKIIDQINSGQGTAGKFIKDPALYDNANQTLAKANQLMTDINAGKGTLGKLAKDEALAKKLDDTVTRLNAILDRIDKGEGTLGKLAVDPSLYNNADATMASTHDLIEAIRKDPKKYLTIHLKLF